MLIDTRSLKFKLIGNLALVFIVLTILLVILQSVLINRLVLRGAYERIKLNMRSGWFVLIEKQRKLEILLDFLSDFFKEQKIMELEQNENLQSILQKYKDEYNLDFLFVFSLKENGVEELKKKLLEANKDSTSGFTRVNLKKLPISVFQYLKDNSKEPELSLIIYSVRQVEISLEGQVLLLAGCMLDGANYLVDQMQNIVFEDRFYRGKRVGTVTLFNDAIRIATTVLMPDGTRATGTRVSTSVEDLTLRKGIPWLGRAKVLDDWYIAYYDPIRDIEGNVIGMLYMGELEAVSRDIRRLTIAVTVIIILTLMCIALTVRIRQTTFLLKRLKKLGDSARAFAMGDYSIRISKDEVGDEITDLMESVNKMLETIDNDRKQLIRQQEMIEEANANYLDMLGFVTHELRNTLGSALFNIALLKEGSFGEISDEAKEGLSIVEDSLSYLQEITYNYLQLSRIEQGEIYVEKVDVNLYEDVVTPVLNEFSQMLNKKNMRVENEIPHDLAFPADVNLIRVVYENLIGNALKYGKEGGKISLTAKKEQGFVQLGIANDGLPIEPALVSSLFHKFRRYDTKTQEGKKGTGLGLFIVRRIIEIHGGEIQVDSGPEKGTIFSIRLPA